MKYFLYFFTFVTFAACCPCDFETPPPIDYSQGRDTSYLLQTIPTAQTKNILIEDVTGVKCQNCPIAHDAIVAIQNANPGRVFAISMHPNGNLLAYPHSSITGHQDFRTEDATILYSFLNTGGTAGIPAGSTDRNLFTGQTGLLNTTPSSWSNFVNQQLPKKTPINLEIDNQYNASTRELIITAKAILTSGLPNDTIYMSIAIIENEIVNPQLLPTVVIDTFYIHNKILRDMVTHYGGSQLLGNYEPGRVFQKGFTVALPPLWKADKCKVIAFVHKSGNIKEVWHVIEKAVK